jgi:hypothetical protein
MSYVWTFAIIAAALFAAGAGCALWAYSRDFNGAHEAYQQLGWIVIGIALVILSLIAGVTSAAFYFFVQLPH